MIQTKAKKRLEPDSNYMSIWTPNGKTYRFAIDPNKPITDLRYPEFYDIKITNGCVGGCPWCYQNSAPNGDDGYGNVPKKLRKFLSEIPEDRMPYQIAYGGGEPTQSIYFDEVLCLTAREFDIVPNFTTNGQWTHLFDKAARAAHLKIVKELCGGVAVSTHRHLKHLWQPAVEYYLYEGIRTNLHVIISNRKSIDTFSRLIDDFSESIEYFVLLPYTNVGRAERHPETLDWNYLIEQFPKDREISKKIAFGALFYPYLKPGELPVNVSTYEPEIMSKYLDLFGEGFLYASSFSTEVIESGFFDGSLE